MVRAMLCVLLLTPLALAIASPDEAKLAITVPQLAGTTWAGDGAVTEAQGYLFSRPVPAVRIRQLLNASHGRRTADEQQLIPFPSRSIA